MEIDIIQFTDIVRLRTEIFRRGLTPYILVNLTGAQVRFYANAVARMVRVAEDCDAAVTYSYYREIQEDGSLRDHPLTDYQFGSVRDSFQFGPVVLMNATDVLLATEPWDGESEFKDFSEYPDGGWYYLQLRIGATRPVCLVQEYLYETPRKDYRSSGERQHDYTALSQAEYQKRMETILTRHLEIIGGLVSGPFNEADLEEGEFPVEASVVIPVRDRVRTVGEAVVSALSQKTDFPYNVIVVDNGSTDGTSQLLDRMAAEDERLRVIHTMPEEGLGIGGCWNRALQSEECGRFAAQLDSDDIYADESTLQKIVDCFRRERCAMVIGSYTLTDREMNPLPGKDVIDHREWSEHNGPNNALRVNGFGAPRAFFVPVAREELFPNVSYGEDYAMCLRICRTWKVGRIFESIYNCRRWEGNSDASLSIEKENAHDYYKDFIRTIELMARVKMNRGQNHF